MAVREVVKEESKENILKFITFGLGREKFAIPIDKVKEIVADYQVVPIPKTPAFIEGIISLRGDIIPVVEMRKRFEMPGSGEDNERRTIILKLNDFVVGIQVDRVYDVLKLGESTIDPPPRLVAGLKSEYLQGLAEVDGRLLIILNLEEIFSTAERIVVKEGFEIGDERVEKKTEVHKALKTGPKPCKVSASGQIRFGGKRYYIGKKYREEEVIVEADEGRVAVLLKGKKIKEFEA